MGIEIKEWLQVLAEAFAGPRGRNFLGSADRYPATPSAGPATSMAALALLQAGKPADALSRADAFLAAHAKAASPEAVMDVRAIRGEALLALGQHADAAAAYRELVATNPDSPKARNRSRGSGSWMMVSSALMMRSRSSRTRSTSLP